MPTDEISWLRQRTIRGTIHQHSRCTERTNQEYIVHMLQPGSLYQPYAGYTQEGTEKAPEMICRLNKRLPVHYIFAYTISAFYPFFQQGEFGSKCIVYFILLQNILFCMHEIQ